MVLNDYEYNLPTETIKRPSAWIGEELDKRPELWLKTLSCEEISELETAADAFIRSDKDIGGMSKNDFPLPSLAPKLDRIKKTLLEGIGFEVLRGLPVSDYSQQKAATIFCGIGAHIGNARSQNAMGHILGHVRDVGADASDPNTRIYQTMERQTFHTDSADIVGLLCLKDAKKGGNSLLVSTETIFNEMIKARPDLVPLLFEPIATDRRGEIPEGEKPFFEIPVLNWYQGYLTGMYQRQYIDSAQRFSGATRLTDKHIEALDLFDKTANDPRLHISMRLAPGDIQLVHNHSMLHDRTGFIDWPDAKERRHLLRLWLSIEGDRPLPECFKQRYGTIEIGNRGGIITKDTALNVPLD